MAASHTSLIRHLQPYLYALIACLTLLAINIIGVDALFNKNIRGPLEDIQHVQADFLDTYLADAEFLEKSELTHLVPGAAFDVPEHTVGTDAGPTLNKLLFWSPHSAIGRQTPLVEPKSREFVMRYNDDWIKGRTYLERGSIKADLSFFKELARFQYWDIEKNSPLEHLISVGEFVRPADLPLPETLDLVTAVKVRLIKGSIDGDAIGALKDVRQLAMLLLTTENFQLVLTGLTCLDLERRAYREYVDREWLDADAWHSIDRNTSMRAGRAFLATAGYFRALTSDAVFKKVFLNGRVPPGFCAALNEQLPLEFAYRSELTGLWPFERSYRQGFAQLDRALEYSQKTCRISFIKKLHDEDAFGALRPGGPWPLTHAPYFRGLFALRDWVTWPSHFDGYQRR